MIRALASTCMAVMLAAAPPARMKSSDISLTLEATIRFAKLALKCAKQEFPNKPDHVLNGPSDALVPQSQHPAFYGCFDWHSSVHGHWMLARLLRQFPSMSEAPEIRKLLDEHLAPSAIAVELAYLDRPGSKGFERPYGWAWLLKLARELKASDAPEAKRWSENLRPLEAAIAKRLAEYLPRLTYPIRSGVHPNTAYALGLALDHARHPQDLKQEVLIVERAMAYFGKDQACPLTWEPGGEDFVSPCLEEAALMQQILAPKEFRTWVQRLLPELFAKGKLEPAVVSDRTDPRIVHLDGLNLSRARCLYTIATSFKAKDPRRALLFRIADSHARASLPHITSGSYEGEHWLATFAVHMLDAREAALAPPSPCMEH